MTKAQTISALKAFLAADQQAAIFALCEVVKYQTAEEKASGTTKYDNGVGLTGTDAEFATSLVKQYERTESLSPKQWGYVTKLAPKYAGQLFRAAEAKRKCAAATAAALVVAPAPAPVVEAPALVEVCRRKEGVPGTCACGPCTAQKAIDLGIIGYVS